MSAKKRILVVDDEPDFCAIVQTNLEKEGFEVELAYNGVRSGKGPSKPAGCYCPGYHDA